DVVRSLLRAVQSYCSGGHGGSGADAAMALVRGAKAAANDRISWNGGHGRAVQRRLVVAIAAPVPKRAALDRELGQKKWLRIRSGRFRCDVRCCSPDLPAVLG